LAAPGAERMLALGMVEAASHPIDADKVLKVVASYATRGTRVLTAGGDANALISLRQALTREGMSVSIAWDAKQAGDLLGMVRPEVAIIDLGLPPRGGYAMVAELAAAKPLPTTLVISRGDDAPAGFAAVLGDRLKGEHVVTREQLLERAVREAAPVR
jgi:CheY-like chemotaxis protein